MAAGRLFLSYAREDHAFLTEFVESLGVLETSEGVEIWYDKKNLAPGDDWDEAIREVIAGSRLAILLVSPSFRGSRYITDAELPELLRAERAGTLTIAPLYVHYSAVDTEPGEYLVDLDGDGPQRISLTRFNALNDPATPLAAMDRTDRNKIYRDAIVRLARMLDDAAPGPRGGDPSEDAFVSEQRQVLQRAVGDQYRIGELLDFGSTALMFRAKEPQVAARDVTIRMTNPHRLREMGGQLEARVKDALSVAGNLKHRSIVTVHAARHAPVMYTVLEYVDGFALRDVIRLLGPQPVGKALKQVIRIGEALDYAHRRGYVHGNVRPSKVMIDLDGWPVLSAFVLDRARTRSQSKPTRMSLSELRYQSPEEFTEQRLPDQWGDQYKLGLVLYELLLGKPIIESTSIRTVVLTKEKFIRDCPPIELDGAIDEVAPDVRAILERMLSRDPGERYSTMREALDDLEQALAHVRSRRDDEAELDFLDWQRTVRSYSRCRAVPSFFESFYGRFTRELPPAVAKAFPANMSHQVFIMREALDTMIWLYREPGRCRTVLERIALSHRQRQLEPRYYDAFETSFLETVAHVDPEAARATPATSDREAERPADRIERAWRKVLAIGFGHLRREGIGADSAVVPVERETRRRDRPRAVETAPGPRRARSTSRG